MRFSSLSDAGVVIELGRRVVAHRQAADLTQDELAAKAGVARSTVQRIEGGDSIQLASLVKLLRALDRLDELERVLSAEARSPLADLERQRRQRQRVRHPSGSSAAPGDGPGLPWTWGDEADG